MHCFCSPLSIKGTVHGTLTDIIRFSLSAVSCNYTMWQRVYVVKQHLVMIDSYYDIRKGNVEIEGKAQ